MTGVIGCRNSNVPVDFGAILGGQIPRYHAVFGHSFMYADQIMEATSWKKSTVPGVLSVEPIFKICTIKNNVFS